MLHEDRESRGRLKEIYRLGCPKNWYLGSISTRQKMELSPHPCVILQLEPYRAVAIVSLIWT
jgi:hypothetical protein